MNPRVLILAMASFAVGTETYVFVGLLATLAADLGVTIGEAGQLATAFAITYALAAPFMAGLTAANNRKRILVAALLVLAVLNALAAVMPNFGALLAVRILCGLTATLVNPVAAAAAAALVPPERRGRALAIVLAGLTLSFTLGIPLGSVVGDAFGWRATFLFSGALALLAAIAVGAVLPDVPSGDRAGLRTLTVGLEPRVLVNLGFTVIAFAATFSVVAFIGPVVTAISGLEGGHIGLMQGLVGVGCLLGAVIGGRIADRAQAAWAVGVIFTLIAATLAVYSVLMLAPASGHSTVADTVMLALTILLGAAALFALAPIVQTRLVAAAPDRRNVVLALNGSMIFLGQGIGAAVGGVTIDVASLAFVGLAGASLAVLGVVLAASTRAVAPVRVSP